MRKFLLSFLSAVCMMACGGQAAWAETEVIDGTNYSSATSLTLTASTFKANGDRWKYNGNKVIQVTPVSESGFDGSVLTLTVKEGHTVTKIEGYMTSNLDAASKILNLDGVYINGTKSALVESSVSIPYRLAEQYHFSWDLSATAGTTIKMEVSTTQNSTVFLLALIVTYDAYSVDVKESVGASTLCVPKAVSIPEGITAYTGSLSDDNTTLTLSTISGTIPANQPVILEGEAGTYSFPFATADAATKVGSLEGNSTAAAVTPTVENATICVLDKVNNELGFYKWEGAIPAYKAYLPVPTAASAPAIRVVYGDEPGNVTAIESIAAEAGESAPIYTLSGRQVKGQVAPGLYIKGGKKILVK